jgi:hypothetical protein
MIVGATDTPDATISRKPRRFMKSRSCGGVLLGV